MAYGRLEIYWPDGRLDTHLLESDTVSVGRAEGNSIALDTEAISRYHFSIIRKDDEISITDLDSANGTFVDGVPLQSNEPRVLGEVEEIQVGPLRILFRKVDDSPTLSMRVHDTDETQRIEREEAHIRLDLDYTRLNVWPASSTSAELSITNTADETRRFSVRVSGMPGEWLRVTRPEVELDGKETSYVLINIKPPRRPNTVPTRYEVTIEVAPTDQPDLTIHALLEVHVQAYSGFGMALVPQLEPGDPVSAFLHNQGSSSLTLTLSATDPQHALNFSLPSAPLTLQPGQRLRVDISIMGKNPPLIGIPTEHSFFFQVKAHDKSGFVAATTAKVKIPPRLPLWGVVSAAGIGLSVAIVALLALLGVLNAPAPTITSLSVNEDQIARGDNLVVSVSAENVDTFEVLVNQLAVQQNTPGDSTEFVIETDELLGEVHIAVIGRNRSGTTEQQISAFVYEPMHIASFTAQPDTLVRYTVGTLTITWDVPGASVVRLSGLSDFTNQLLQSSTEYGGTEILEGISGIPLQPLEITLSAEDEAGNVLQEVLTIPLIDPECTALETIALFEGPNERYQQVGSVPQDTRVVVTAQDAEAGWLRVQLPGNVRGWGPSDAFVCADTFRLADLRTEMNLPELPTDIPAASLTSTPAPTNPGRRQTPVQPSATQPASAATADALRSLPSPTAQATTDGG